jgi:TolB-like protein/DNA-binding SARP family transcriptional activator
MRRPGDIRLELLGGFSVNVAGNPPTLVRISPKKGRALLAYLAMQPQHCGSREQLATLLWGDRCGKQARQSLRQCLRWLRRDLTRTEPALLYFDGEKIGLQTQFLTVDADEFAALARSTESSELERAAGLYRGEFIAGCDLDEEAFADWVRAERSRLQVMAAQVFVQCAERFDAVGDGAKAIDTTVRLVGLDPLREDWQRSLLRLRARYEGCDAAMADARALTALLKKELDVEPAPATKALVAEIERGEIASVSIAVRIVRTCDAIKTVRAAPVTTSAAPGAPQGRLANPRPRSDKPSVVVLPLVNLSEDQDREHFADAIMMDIITALSRIRSLSVVACGSCLAYRGWAADERQTRRDLGADYVLEGSVRRVKNRVRVTVQLVDAGTGINIWGQRYDRTLGDVLLAQSEIAADIAASIEPRLYAAEDIRARRRPFDALDARGCVMRGHALINMRSRQNYNLAEELLNRAIDLAPDCAQAYSLLAYVLALNVVYGWKPRERFMALAGDAARTAVLLDVDAPWAHLALGFVYAQCRLPEEAILEYEKALALNPSFSLAHTYLGSALSHLGRTEAALAQIDVAERISPSEIFFGVNNYVRANAHFAAERYQVAGIFARRSVRESPGIVTSHRQLVVNCALAGEIPQARAAFRTLLRLVPGTSLASINEALPYGRERDRSRFLDAFSRMGLS